MMRFINKSVCKTVMFLVVLCLTSVSCNKYNAVEHYAATVNHELCLQVPLNIKELKLQNAQAVITNILTSNTYIIDVFNHSGTDFVGSVLLPEGVYNMEVRGAVIYVLNGKEVKTDVKAMRHNVTISTENTVTNLALNVYTAQEGFVINELFFTGTTTPNGFMYIDDQYIKIGNNSDTVMYADGLAFVESFFTSDDKHDYQPDIIKEAMTVSAVYVIPGTGREHKVNPGECITIALTAIDHRRVNPLSFDLSFADFEIYDKSSNVDNDKDNPKVPNLVNWCANFAGTFSMHTRGVKSYALARPMIDMNAFMKEYRYKFGYIFKQADFVIQMNENEYFLPNTWILDAVNLAIPTSHEWNIISPVLDKGFTYCGNVDSDENRYNKSVVRKKKDRKWIDTNNSSYDFEPNAVPSFLRQ